VPSRGGVRRWIHHPLVLVAACIALCTPACNQSEPPTAAVIDPASRPALKVIFANDHDDPTKWKDRIETAWKGISSQAIDVEVAASKAALENVSTTDVYMLPASMIGEAISSGRISPIPPSFLDSAQVDQRNLLPIANNEAARWLDRTYFLPAGFPGMVVFSGPSVPPPTSTAPSNNHSRDWTWLDYEQWVSSLASGANSDPANSDPANSDPANSDPANSDPANSDPANSDPANSERGAESQTKPSAAVAAEPLAAGYAVWTLLNRAADYSNGSWLFDRRDMEPLLVRNPEYLRALEELLAMKPFYPSKGLTPEAISRSVANGTLKAGVGWPAIGDEGTATSWPASAMRTLPRGGQVFREGQWQPTKLDEPWYVPCSLGWVVAVGNQSRQSQVARSFAAWLAIEEGQQTLQQVSSLATVTRRLRNEEGIGTAFDQAMRTRWDTSRSLPMLRIPGTPRYLDALDQAVRRAWAGEQSPQEALQQAASQWKAITESLGRSNQRSAWLASQGIALGDN
jgi:maltose-binding protein MalE